MSPARENNPWVQGCRERVAPLRLQTDCRHGSARVAFKRAYPNFNPTTTMYPSKYIILTLIYLYLYVGDMIVRE